MTAHWRDDAACDASTATLFDEATGTSSDTWAREEERVGKAAAICATCPVVDACLIDAVKHHDSGVRGGQLLDHGKPRTVRHKPSVEVAPHGTRAAYRRHLRHGQQPCTPCRAAYASRRRVERGAAA